MIKEIIDLDPFDFIIKWRIINSCNAKCSYCLRKEQRDEIINLEERNLTLSNTAKEISNLVNNTSFNNVKIDLIGGEVSLLDLPTICSNLNSKKIKRINITTNLLKEVEYYINLCNVLHSNGLELSCVASFHYEFQNFEKYFSKILILKDYFDVLGCEMVSTIDNQELVKKFISKCEENNLQYLVDKDLRINSEKERSLISVDSRRNNPRYKVVFSDGTEKIYNSRNKLLTDTSLEENYYTIAIKTTGFNCTQSNDFIYIDLDTVVGRTINSNKCTNRIPIKEFKLLEPKVCESNSCTLCGHVSLFRN